MTNINQKVRIKGQWKRKIKIKKPNSGLIRVPVRENEWILENFLLQKIRCTMLKRTLQQSSSLKEDPSIYQGTSLGVHIREGKREDPKSFQRDKDGHIQSIRNENCIVHSCNTRNRRQWNNALAYMWETNKFQLKILPPNT